MTKRKLTDYFSYITMENKSEEPLQKKSRIDPVPGVEEVFAAIEAGKLTVLGKYLGDGGNVRAVNAEGESFLHAMIKHETPIDIVRKFICSFVPDLDQVTIRNESCLHYAASLEDHNVGLAIIRLLYEYGADFGKSDAQGYTVLHRLVKQGAVGTVRYILAWPRVNEMGIDFFAAIDNAGNTALHLAAFEGHFETVAVLLQKWIVAHHTINRESISGFTALALATMGNHPMVMEVLARNGYSQGLNVRGCNGETLVHLAAWHGADCAMRFLADQKVSLNAQDAEGSTPLFFAVRAKNPAMIRMLVANGADIGVENFWGDSIRTEAQKTGDREIIDLVENLINVSIEKKHFPELKQSLCLSEDRGAVDLDNLPDEHSDIAEPIEMESFAPTQPKSLTPEEQKSSSNVPPFYIASPKRFSSGIMASKDVSPVGDIGWNVGRGFEEKENVPINLKLLQSLMSPSKENPVEPESFVSKVGSGDARSPQKKPGLFADRVITTGAHERSPVRRLQF
ncbi:MAG: serine/threonine-protein phosphatase 6 regulatory ankyrin repeat subunit B-like [Rickettsiales bacterium]|jgi:ankyrin repeat protein|nr:serine/threonine-protein phosphatase 6 regulatory ankyrin repeat subunit B-like [Rickettsiales bacterium]